METTTLEEYKNVIRGRFNELSDEEKTAVSSYQAYLNRVYLEMIDASLVSVNDEDASIETVQAIRPEAHRIQAITELVLHVQRISLVGDEGK